MADKGGSVHWEEILDQELAELIERGYIAQEASSGRVVATLAPTDGKPGEEDRSISAAQFREEVFDSIREGRGLPLDIYDESGALFATRGFADHEAIPAALTRAWHHPGPAALAPTALPHRYRHPGRPAHRAKPRIGWTFSRGASETGCFSPGQSMAPAAAFRRRSEASG